MKRIHIHVGVEDLNQSIAFYTALFGAEPSKVKSDYAKWMLEDPRMNFAISLREGAKGLDHMGIQVEKKAELDQIRKRLSNAEASTYDEGETVCCYARSEKSWVKDPSGIAWEAYETMEDVEFFKEAKASEEKACCAPAQTISEPR